MPEILIWGASGGIGSALVKRFKREGWRVFGAARDELRIPAEADVTTTFDAREAASFDRVALLVAQQSDGLDLMIYAAGSMTAQSVEAFDSAAWSQIMDANLNGFYHSIRTGANLLKDGAQVMVIGAHVDKISFPRFGPYAAAKAGLEPLMTILQKEHRKLKFTLVRPGAVETAFWEQVPFRLPADAMQAEDVAEAILGRSNSGDKGVLDL